MPEEHPIRIRHEHGPMVWWFGAIILACVAFVVLSVYQALNGNYYGVGLGAAIVSIIVLPYCTGKIVLTALENWNHG